MSVVVMYAEVLYTCVCMCVCVSYVGWGVLYACVCVGYQQP